MNPKTSSRILVLLSMAYGITIGILAALGSDAMVTFATIGAPVLGLLWVARGMFVKRDQTAS